MKKLLWIIIPALLLIIIIGYFSVNKPNSKNFSPGIEAIPQDVSFFVETQDFTELIAELSKNQIWTSLLKTNSFPQVKKYYVDAAIILNNYPKIKDILSSNKTYLAVRRQGKNKVDLLLVMAFKNYRSLRDLNKAIAEALLQNKIKLSKTDYNDQKVFFFTANGQKYYFSFTNGLFLFSRSYLFLQNSLRQLLSNSSLRTIPEFNLVTQKAGSQSPTTIYINYSNLKYAFINQLSAFGNIQMTKLGNFAAWSSYDIQLSGNFIRMLGYTSVDEKLSKFLRIFYGVEPEKFYVDKILPGNTVKYEIFTFSDYIKFMQNYQKYLTTKDLNNIYKQKLIEIKNKYKVALDIAMYNIIDNSITVAKVKENPLSNTTYNYLLLKIKSTSAIKKLLQEIITSYANQHNISPKSFVTKYPNTNISIYKLPDSSLFTVLYGQLAHFTYQKYAFILDNYLVLTSNKNAIKSFINSYLAKDFLFNRKDYKQFRVNITPRTNYIIYIHKPLNSPKIKYYLTPQAAQNFSKYRSFFNGVDNFASEFYFSDGVFISFALLNFNPQKAQNQSIWNKKLYGKIITKPFIFINHNTGAKEIFVGDDKGNIYLINRNGQILWSRNIGEPIAGQIYMIDYYQNHKFQLLFNTKSKIYIIDRLGRDVANFPITPPDKISTSISVFNYEKDGNYRIFVPCANNKVYLYNKKGKLNPQWLITQLTAPLTMPVQHFLYKGKDYIVFADDQHTYILNRRGETRIEVKRNFAKAPNTPFYLIPADSKHPKPMFVTTTTSGKLAFIDFQGNVFFVNTPGKFTDNHSFVLKDLDGDNNYEFIFAQDDKVYIYQEENKAIKLTATFAAQGNIIPGFTLYNFGPGKIKVGFVTDKNLIYLIDKAGKLHKGFPKEGSTKFTITQLIKDNGFNVLTGQQNFLINYRL